MEKKENEVRAFVKYLEKKKKQMDLQLVIFSAIALATGAASAIVTDPAGPTAVAYIFAITSAGSGAWSLGGTAASYRIDDTIIDKYRDLADEYHVSLEQSLEGCS